MNTGKLRILGGQHGVSRDTFAWLQETHAVFAQAENIPLNDPSKSKFGRRHSN
jgi:hypothetical protein